ncbi:MAG: hypothetical protein RLZ66_599 [Pseudomonadota bacterium]
MATSKSSAAAHRIHDEPAFVLHRYPWSESSLILETFTRHRGRVVMIAKGAKRPTSNFRPILLPLQPLRLDYSGDAEIRTLKGAEWVGGHVMPTGEALLSGYYLNELLLRLLARDDPHPSLFDVYRQTVHVLAGGVSSTTAPALRAFELLLLQDVGLLPALDMQTMSLQPLDENTLYELVPEGGLRSLPHDDAHQRHALPGLQWQSLQAAMDSSMPFTATLRMCAEWPAEWRSQLQAQLRALLHVHCGVGSLRTRQIMMDIQSL